MPLPLSPPVFAIVRALIEERLGLHYGDDQREALATKLSARAVEVGFDSLLDYYYFLKYDPAGKEEMDRLAEHLVVNETYLFRERPQLDVIVDRIVAPRVLAGRRPRLWSAACATGEEPLTLAMLLAARSLLDRVEIVASDLSGRALAQAKTGLLGRRSLRQDPVPQEALRWLRRRDERLEVAPELVVRIAWHRLNLLDRPAVRALGRFDVVLCRNLLIYFRDEVTLQVVETLREALSPDGVLAVGISESLMRFGGALACEEVDGAFLYRSRA